MNVDDKIINVAEKLGLKANWISDELHVYSDIGYTQEWFLEQKDGKLILRHKNTRGNKNALKHEHKQTVYKTTNKNAYIKALWHIKSHDRYNFIRDARNRKMELYYMIENNQVPYIKLD